MKMLRGCQKRIYFMKNTGSSYFEEAYFILKNDISDASAAANVDLAREADRIIKESSVYYRGKGRRRLALNRAAMFALGAASSSAVIGIISFLVYM